MVLHNQGNAEEKVIYRVNPQICTDIPYASISTSFLKHEWRSKRTGKAKRTLAPSVFPSQLLTQRPVCHPSHLTGEASDPTLIWGAAATPVLPFPQDWVGFHPVSLYSKSGAVQRVRRTGKTVREKGLKPGVRLGVQTLGLPGET